MKPHMQTVQGSRETQEELHQPNDAQRLNDLQMPKNGTSSETHRQGIAHEHWLHRGVLQYQTVNRSRGTLNQFRNVRGEQSLIGHLNDNTLVLESRRHKRHCQMGC